MRHSAFEYHFKSCDWVVSCKKNSEKLKWELEISRYLPIYKKYCLINWLHFRIRPWRNLPQFQKLFPHKELQFMRNNFTKIYFASTEKIFFFCKKYKIPFLDLIPDCQTQHKLEKPFPNFLLNTNVYPNCLINFPQNYVILFSTNYLHSLFWYFYLESKSPDVSELYYLGIEVNTY